MELNKGRGEQKCVYFLISPRKQLIASIFLKLLIQKIQALSNFSVQSKWNTFQLLTHAHNKQLTKKKKRKKANINTKAENKFKEQERILKKKKQKQKAQTI